MVWPKLTDLGKVERYGTMPVVVSDGTFEGLMNQMQRNATKFGIEIGEASKFSTFLALNIQFHMKNQLTVDGKEINDTTAFDSGSYDASTDTVTYDASSNIDPFESSEVKYIPPMITIGGSYSF